MTKKTLFTILQYIVFLGLGIGIIYYMSSQLSADQKTELFNDIKSVNTGYLVGIVIIGALSHWFRGLRWKLMLEPMDIKPTSANTFFAVMIGYMVNLAIPRGGEVAKCTVLARYEKVPADKMIGTIVAERAFDVLCLLLITILAFVIEAEVIGQMISDVAGAKAGSGTLYIILIAGLIAGLVMLWIINKYYRQTKIGKFIQGLAAGVTSIARLRKSGLFLLYTILIWFLYWLQILVGFWALEATMQLSAATALIVLIVGTVGIIATPGGIGAYPALVAKALLVYGIAETHGLAFGWVAWSVQMGVVLLLGIISLILLPIFNRTTHNAQVTMDRE